MKLHIVLVLLNCICIYSKDCNDNFAYCVERNMEKCPVNLKNEFALPYNIDSDTCKRLQYGYDNKMTSDFPNYLLDNWSSNNCCSAGGEKFWEIIDLVNSCYSNEGTSGTSSLIRKYTHREKCHDLVNMISTYSKNQKKYEYLVEFYKNQSEEYRENLIYSIILIIVIFKIYLIIF
jgi:hypothetical protein